MPPRLPCSSISPPSTLSSFQSSSASSTRSFSSSHVSKTRLRRQMFAWLEGPGENFKHPLPGSTNYLSAYSQSGALKRKGEDTPETPDDLRPFPLNKHFFSEPILSQDLRREIWRRVQVDKKSVRTVSVELGVEMRRVGAVVRLMEVENRMKAEGMPLATAYARAIHEMVPTTPYTPGNITPHEPINDLPVHARTDPQLFYPTSESRAFNRTDAGRVFSAAPGLLIDQTRIEPWQDTRRETVGKGRTEESILKPADARIPHPHLIAYAKDRTELSGKEDEIRARYSQRLEDDAQARAEARQRRIDRDEAQKTRIEGRRWQFVVTDVKVSRQTTGSDGRGAKGVGMRYGVPFQDRKKGQIKIPTRVNV